MINTLSSAYTTAAGSVRTSPALLVKVVFSVGDILLLSSYGNVSMGAENYVSADISVSGLSSDISANTNGQLRIGVGSAGQEAMVAYALRSDKGFTDKQIIVYAFDGNLVSAGVLDIANTLKIFDGIGDGVSIDPMAITVTLASSNLRFMYAPRLRIIPTNGFNYLQPQNTRIPWGTEIFILE